MTRLLVLTPAPTSSASTRFRLEQFFPVLRARGIEPILRPFLDEDGFRVLYRPGHLATKARAAASALVGRIGDLVRATRCDAVLLHREAALIGPPLLEWLMALPMRRPIIFDLDDAVWVPYASPTYGSLLSRLLKAPGKTLRTLAMARSVIAGNRFIADFAGRFNPRVSVIPTVVDTDVFRPAERRADEVPVLGWVGTPSAAQYVQAIVPALQSLARKRRFRLRVVGGTIDAPGLEVEHREWRLERELEEFRSLDIGLYPLVEDDWSLGKSGFKAVQYMAAGVPMVASPVGCTNEMIDDGRNGLLARNPAEWESQLERLLDDAALRRRLADEGRKDAVARWSLAVHAPRFADLVTESLA
jgi:glycosyltransferase involved in cell wall biosynthesis